MKRSPEIDKVLESLFKVKSELTGVKKTADNPYYSSKYADLNSHLETVEPLLAKHDLILLQPVAITPTGRSVVETTLMHSSGQFVASEVPLVLLREDMQQLGSAVSYARRYGLGALLSMRAEDDDANTASDVGKKETKTSTSKSSGFSKPKSNGKQEPTVGSW